MLRTWILLLAAFTTGSCSSGYLDGDETCGSLPQQGRGTLHGVACLQAKTKGRVKNLEEEEPNPMSSGTCDPSPTPLLDTLDLNDDAAKSFIASSAMHTIVGKDGVVMLSLVRDPVRFRSAASRLSQVGIKSMRLAATDAHCASKTTLNKGCGLHHDPDDKCHTNDEGWFDTSPDQWKKAGEGCQSQSEQAICDSHRRALEFAQSRGNEWTLIMEDDAIPVVPDGVNWDTSLKQAWEKVPKDAKIVRLAWCRFDDLPDDPPDVEIVLVGGFKYTRGTEKTYGGCPIATLYHRSIIPEFLKIFPCCGAIDACSAWDFYFRPQAISADNPEGKRNVDRVLWNLQVNDSPQVIRNLQSGSMYGRHFGIMMPSGKASTRDI